MHLLQRLAFMIPLMLLISFLAFVLVRVAPGGPFDKERTPASPEIERNLKAKYHLDESILRQYFRYLGGVVRGDFGPSLKYRSHGVAEIIAQGLPVSLTLGALSFLFASGLGIPLGILSAVRRGRLEEKAATFLAFLAVCVPPLVVGPILIMLFGIQLNWLPVALWDSPRHALLPMVTLGFFFSGRIARLTREGLLNTLQSEFIVAARAKGLSESAVVLKQALPLAILPVVSYSGPLLADLLTGSFVVENIFQIPGIGVAMVNSSLNRDYTLVVGLVILYAGLLLVLNLLVDLSYSLLDPRMKHD